MKILIISPIFPFPVKSGGQTRLYNIIKHLSEDFDIHLLSLIGKGEENHVIEMQRFCSRVETIYGTIHNNSVEKIASLIRPSQLARNIKRIIQWTYGTPLRVCRFYHGGFMNKLKKMLERDSYDVVYSFYYEMAPYLIYAKSISKDIKTALDEIELSFAARERECVNKNSIGRLLCRLEYRRTLEYVSNNWNRFDRIIAVSEVDRNKLSGLVPELRVNVIPNGVDTDHFQLSGPGNRGSKLAFLGGSLHYPNVDGVAYFAKEIFPLVKENIPRASLTIIGEFDRKLLNGAGEHIRFTGYVNDVRPHLNEHALLIVPIRIAGGTRLKILEAMASGMPVVSTSVGCEGIEAVSGKDVIIADTPADFTKGIKAVLTDKTLRKTLTDNARRLVEEKYSWNKIVSDLKDELSGDA